LANSLLKNKTDEGQDGSVIRTTPAGTTEINADIDAAVKGKKTASGIETACATVLQTWTDKIAEQEKKLVARYEKIPADKLHLFTDISTVLTAGDIDALIAERLAAEDERQAAEKARIEAAAKAEAEARAKAEAPEQTETTPQIPPQEEGEVEDYRIVIHASLARAKDIARLVKERYPKQFVALKKGKGE